ncbi:MAG: GNAT family N-acetyltransferase [Limnochordaceae bacterium]|nr:GNAT family N-acetyltransferase [Limnochordaceae bacterium]
MGGQFTLQRFTVRELASPTEFKQTEAVQQAAWGMDDIDVVPAATMIAIAREGGLAAGAFEGGRVVGFVFGFPTADPKLQHSHMLAVLPEYRGTGLAVRLKLFQRAWCLARGIDRVVWTYDPLLGLNATFNVRKLGCVVRTYLADCYGPLSGVNAGVPTDRFLAEWALTSARVEAAVKRLEGARGEAGCLWPGSGSSSGASGAGRGDDGAEANARVAEPPLANLSRGERPVAVTPAPEGPRVAVQIPDDFSRLLRSDPALAMEWRLHARELFSGYFSKGYAVVDFMRAGGRNFYVLERER